MTLPRARETPRAAVLPRARQTFDDDGYVVLHQAVDPVQVATALRRLNLAIRHHGLTAEEIASCQLATFFPHLRWEPEVWAALPPSAAELLGWREGDQWGDPQILMRFPDEEQSWSFEPHVDTLPEWAQDRFYRGIVGVALTTAGADDGAVCVWPGSHRGRPGAMTAVALEAGDAIVMHPQLGHTGTLNLGPTIRVAIYFRLLAGPTGGNGA